jgi:hypothetical protein
MPDENTVTITSREFFGTLRESGWSRECALIWWCELRGLKYPNQNRGYFTGSETSAVERAYLRTWFGERIPLELTDGNWDT